MRKIVVLSILFFVTLPLLVNSQGLKSFVLPNGLKVFVWEDAAQTDVFGMVAVKAGSVNDPEQYTGLAHYLEHVMFKGTDRIGALNWVEEMPIYEQIIAKYEERAAAVPEQIAGIDEEINLLSAQQAALTRNNEFNALVESMGGTGLNAGTGYDVTMYYNKFPKVQLDKWLDLYSVRFINPVFRTFQTELETVYEEYNMYQDDANERQRQGLFKYMFEGTPYARSIIGYAEHLKNPRLSQLIAFYEQYYVPENMALILVGDLKTEEIVSAISRRFSRIPAKPLIKEPVSELPSIKGRKQIKEKLGLYPMVGLAFNGVAKNHSDYPVLLVLKELLSNRSQTGMLDKLSLQGDIMYGGASNVSFVGGGRILIQAVPNYDYGQGRYESHRFIERLLLENLNKISSTDLDESLLASVKGNLIRSYLRQMEDNEAKGSWLADMFSNDLDLDFVLNYPDIISAVSTEDIQRVASKYLSKDFLAFHISEEGKIKPQHLEKPDLPHAIEFPFDGETVYSQWFRGLPVAAIDLPELSYEDIVAEPINEKSRMFYVPNEVNDVFSMTLKYQVGEREMPLLAYATPLMNSAGVLGALESSEFREALSSLNATVSYRSNDDYLFVDVEGVETHLIEICQLITRQILMPKLDEKQLNRIKGAIYQERRIEKDQIDYQEDALLEYVLYGSDSEYLNRLKWEDVMKLGISQLTGVFQRATDYAAEVHYSGRLPFEQAHAVLSANLPLKASELDGLAVKDKEYVSEEETIIYFVPNSNATQSRIWFVRPLESFDVSKEVLRMGFTRYFGEGFTGLVTQEIREKRSMAYASAAFVLSPSTMESNYGFRGFVGTQGDKTVEAVEVFVGLVNEMPVNASRIHGIKDYLGQALVTSQPSFRYRSQTYEAEKILGFEAPRSQVLLPFVEDLTFDDIVGFYEKNLKNKPLIIGIVGNPSTVDVKALERFGKVVRLNSNSLFN